MYNTMALQNYPLVLVLIAATLRCCSCEGFFDRFQRPSPQKLPENQDETIQIVHGKVKRFERQTLPILTYPPNYVYYTNQPMWQASAIIVPDEPESPIAGIITFEQWPSNNFIKLRINVTGLPVGKHALHIHTFGDLSDGCTSTGGQFPNNFIGNVDAQEDGSISSSFLSAYLNLFGFHGIIGRSIVIHSKPIDINNSLNAEVFSSSLQALPETVAFQNEENSVGPAIACGIITVTRGMNGDGMPIMPVMTMSPPTL